MQSFRVSLLKDEANMSIEERVQAIRGHVVDFLSQISTHLSFGNNESEGSTNHAHTASRQLLIDKLTGAGVKFSEARSLARDVETHFLHAIEHLTEGGAAPDSDGEEGPVQEPLSPTALSRNLSTHHAKAMKRGSSIEYSADAMKSASLQAGEEGSDEEGGGSDNESDAASSIDSVRESTEITRDAIQYCLIMLDEEMLPSILRSLHEKSSTSSEVRERAR